jgi:hypothetical protein
MKKAFPSGNLGFSTKPIPRERNLRSTNEAAHVCGEPLETLLVRGVQDVDVVQQYAIVAVSRFREIEGDLLSDLIPYLTDERVSMAGVLASLG